MAKPGLMLTLCLASIVTPCYADSHYVDAQIQMSHMQRHTEILLAEAESRISAYLTPSEREIQRQATIKVPANYALIAHAYPGTIEISSGTFWILEQLTMAHIADRELNFSGCEADYTKYLAGGLMRQDVNRKKIVFKQLPLETYALKFGGSCVGFKSLEITVHGADKIFYRMMQASMNLIYLHELGHHILGHVQNLPTDSTYSRNVEAAADAWAIEAAFRSGFYVLDGIPALNLIAAIGADSPETVTRTHPRGSRRVRNMMQQAMEILSKAGKDEIVAWLNDSLQHREQQQRANRQRSN